MDRKLQIERSGLGGFFTHAAIVKEKDAAAYRALAVARGFDPGLSWMIGNSPKSDINSALEAGWNAVFVPHAAPGRWRGKRSSHAQGGCCWWSASRTCSGISSGSVGPIPPYFGR